MEIDYFYFVTQRARNAAWNLLCANRAPVILAFVHEAFIKQGRTSAPESELVEILKDIIFKLNGGRLEFNGSEPLDEGFAHIDDYLPDAAKGEAAPSAPARDLDTGEMRDDPLYYLRYWS